MKDIRKFKLPSGEIVQLRFIPFKKLKNIAVSPIDLGFIKIGKIKVSELFYNRFKYPEQVSIIYHEIWHRENNLKHELKMIKKKPWLLFYIKPILHSQEYKADLYARKKTNKKDTISMLKIIEKLIIQKILPEKHEGTHPKIKDRINAIEKS